MISCSSVGERLIVDPEDWDSAEMEAIDGVGSILAIAVVDLLKKNETSRSKEAKVMIIRG